MEVRKITVTYKAGADVTKLSGIVRSASAFRSVITLSCQNKSANAKSFLSIMAIQIEPGMPITITAEGPDEKEAADAMADALDPLGKSAGDPPSAKAQE